MSSGPPHTPSASSCSLWDRHRSYNQQAATLQAAACRPTFSLSAPIHSPPETDAVPDVAQPGSHLDSITRLDHVLRRPLQLRRTKAKGLSFLLDPSLWRAPLRSIIKLCMSDVTSTFFYPQFLVFPGYFLRLVQILTDVWSLWSSNVTVWINCCSIMLSVNECINVTEAYICESVLRYSSSVLRNSREDSRGTNCLHQAEEHQKFTG